MREEVEKMSADTTAPHLLYNLDYHHKLEPSTSFLSGPSTAFNISNGYRESSRKRKCQIFDDDSDYFEDDDAKSTKTDCDTKSNGSGRPSNHSEIEKRRRDKMNGFITEISSLVPTCAAISRKLDKLTVLRLAVQHIKTIRGSSTTLGCDSLKPNFITDDELKTMLKKTCDGFLLAVSCDTGKILYVSDQAVNYIGWNQDDLLEQSFVDLVHKEDVSIFKEQMNWLLQSVGNDRILTQKSTRISKDSSIGSASLASFDAESSIFSSGSKRAFYCRFNDKSSKGSRKSFVLNVDHKTTANTFDSNSELSDIQILQHDLGSTNELGREFYCCGFLKSWLQASEIAGGDNECDDLSNVCSMILLARSTKNFQSDISANLQCTVRVELNGKIVSVDQSFKSITGYLQTDVAGTSYYKYVHDEDLHEISEHFKKSINNSLHKTFVQYYRFKTKNGTFIKFSSELLNFRNPWTKKIDFVLIKQKLFDYSGESDTKFLSRMEKRVFSDKISKQSTLLELLSKNEKITEQSPSHVKGRKGDSKHVPLRTQLVEPAKSYGSNKSVIISTEPVSNQETFRKLSYCNSDKLLNGTFTDVCSSPSSYRKESTALSVVMNILDAESCMTNNTDYCDVNPLM